MRKVLLTLLVAGLAACASTPPQYYSLLAGGVGSGMTPGHEAGRVKKDYAISVEPVVVPEEVARPQIVVSTAHDPRVIPLNAALWAAPLEAQLRQAFGNALSRRLNVLDIGQSGAANSLPVWRIYVDVQRFDSVYDESVQQHIVWRMVPQGMPSRVTERTCSARVELPVGTGMSSLVDGHRQAIDILADVIAQALPGSGAQTSRVNPPNGKSGTPAGDNATTSDGDVRLQVRGCVG